jgi:hypothetical protein
LPHSIPPSLPHNGGETESAAGLFDLLTTIAANLKTAEKKKQCWKTVTEGMRNADGERNDGLDIRIRIYPSGVATDPMTPLADE